MRRHHTGRATDAARCVHAHHRLAHRTESVGEIELRHHHAFEHVRRLADDDRVDVRPGEPGVLERTQRGLADQPGHRHVLPLSGVLRLPDTDDRYALAHAASLPNNATRFCCRQAPLVACAIAVCTLPDAIAFAAPTSRDTPPTIVGRAAALTFVPFSCNASRRISS